MQLPSRFTAVVTGAASGLGRELALELASRGGRVVVSDIDAAGAERTTEELRATGAQAWAVACDVADWQQVEALAARARELAGEVDLVVNNAGVGVGGAFAEIPLEDWHWQIDINLWGVIHGCRAFAPAMRARRRGWILNVASAAGFACLAEFSPYNVSKAGVIALSETLRAELEPHGVAVTVACPSFFQTNIVEAGRGEGDETKALMRQLMRRSRVQAVDVARDAITSLERGRLHAVPMRDARLAWAVKRAFPGAFHRVANLARRALALTASA